jgi:hypothetical protein
LLDKIETFADSTRLTASRLVIALSVWSATRRKLDPDFLVECPSRPLGRETRYSLMWSAAFRADCRLHGSDLARVNFRIARDPGANRHRSRSAETSRLRRNNLRERRLRPTSSAANDPDKILSSVPACNSRLGTPALFNGNRADRLVAEPCWAQTDRGKWLPSCLIESPTYHVTSMGNM